MVTVYTNVLLGQMKKIRHCDLDQDKALAEDESTHAKKKKQIRKEVFMEALWLN